MDPKAGAIAGASRMIVEPGTKDLRIAYVAHLSGQSDPGVIHKIAGQAAAWRGHGHTVKLFVATRDRAVPWSSRLGDSVVRQFDGPVDRIRAVNALVAGARRFQPSIVYLRWDVFYPPMLWFPRRAALVVEINTDDLGENALGTRPRALYNAATRGILLGRARALVFVTSELSRRAAFSRYRNRHCVITNGIDLEAYPVLPARPHDGTRLVFVGSAGQPWQGIDKVLTLASLRPDWRFDVVGMTADSGSRPANVTWHGQLDRTALVEVLAGADIGLGTLALHRKAMDEASSLKVREYLALGLPVIYANVDLDADGLGEYVLRIANTESNVVDELPRIDAFVERARGLRVPRSHLAHLDVAHKEEQRLALFQELAGA